MAVAVAAGCPGYAQTTDSKACTEQERSNQTLSEIRCLLQGQCSFGRLHLRGWRSRVYFALAHVLRRPCPAANEIATYNRRTSARRPSLKRAEIPTTMIVAAINAVVPMAARRRPRTGPGPAWISSCFDDCRLCRQCAGCGQYGEHGRQQLLPEHHAPLFPAHAHPLSA